MTVVRRLLVAVAIAALVSVTSAAAGNAANFRFWGFFQQTDGAWAAASVGAAQAVPEHGAVDGWRYAVVGDTEFRMPRTDLTFDDICPGAEPVEGSKVVAVVIDNGTPEDSPDDGEVPGAYAGCAEVDADATSMDVLADVTDAVDEGGFVCAIGGYPEAGCDPNEVPGAAPTDDESTVDVTLPGVDAETPAAGTGDSSVSAGEDDESGSGGTVIAIVAIAVVVLLAAAALVRSRRSRPSD